MKNDLTERYENALSLANEISGTILSNQDHQDVLDDIVERVAQTFNARAGSIAIPDDDDKHFRYIAGFNREDGVLERMNTTKRLELDEGVAGRAYTHEEICSVNNIFNNNLFDEKYYSQAKAEGIRALFSVPLRVFGECIGVLTLYYGNVTQFDQSTNKIMNMVADQVALAMLQSNKIEELEEHNSRLKRRAETDSLTGLPNHGKIQSIFRREMKRAERYDLQLSLMMIDIDHFKKINDTHGHPVGDDVLKHIADCFLRETRDVDAVGRYGGEEFMFIVPETGLDQAQQVAERLREAVEEIKITDTGEVIDPTISIGLDERTNSRDTADDLIERADQALIHAKRTGRNRTYRYSSINGECPPSTVAG